MEDMEDIYKELVRTMKKFDVEFFLFEAPFNDYKPKPPEGFFGMRSNKRRIFLPLNNGAYPHLSVVDNYIKSGNYSEQPL